MKPWLIKKMRLSLAFKNNTFTYGFQKHKGNHGLNFSLFFSLWFCTYNAITLMKTRGRTLSVHTCRVHFHKIEQHLAMGLPFLFLPRLFHNFNLCCRILFRS